MRFCISRSVVAGLWAVVVAADDASCARVVRRWCRVGAAYLPPADRRGLLRLGEMVQ